MSISIPTPDADNKAGSQFVRITTEGQWYLEVEGEPDWVTISMNSGFGNASVRMDWTANEMEDERACTLTVRSETGKYHASRNFIQLGKDIPVVPGADGLKPDPVAKWMELPTTQENDGRYFITHEMTVGSYKGRNYSLYLDADAKIAVWVAYPLNKGLIGSGSRTNQWGLDPKIPTDYQSVIFSGYYGGYQRGHQLPSADRLTANVSTFYGSNMTPQRGELNEKAWASLEGMVRTWSNSFDTLYVVTGADIVGATEYANDNAFKKITVPVGYFKALLGYKKGGTVGITGTTGGYTGIGFYFEHKGYSENDVMPQAMTIDALENKTGFDFFPNLKAKIGESLADRVESTRDSWWK